MANAKIKFDGREIEIVEDLTLLGRASDNTISFGNDSNVSRYHAEIERRGADFYLIDLRSRNGTIVNGEPVEGERLLKSGDLVTLGNSATVEFLHLDSQKSENPEKTEKTAPAAPAPPAAGPAPDTAAASDVPAASKLPVMLIVAGAACGLAVVFVVAAILFSYRGGPCEARGAITSPAEGDLLKETAKITVHLEDPDECARRAIFLLDGVEFASSDEPPFAATIDPNNFPELADGLNHDLKIVLEDAAGNKIPQTAEVALAFETKAIETPTPTPGPTGEPPTPTPVPSGKGKATLTEIQAMSDKLIKSLNSSAGYRLDREFLEEVQKKTNDYAATEGFSARARQYQDVIKNAYLVETDLGAPIGFLTAMSRSRFDPQKQGAEEGLWRMSNDFAAANSLNVGCAESLSDARQICAAKASSLYLKSLLRTVFEGDVVFAAAAFGMSPEEAFAWKQTLPSDRSDFWKVIKSTGRRDELIRFFAAGIVAENPQQFGLKKDEPISRLY